MLARYTSECLVPIINTVMVSKNLPVDIKILIPVKFLVFSEYVKMRESFSTRVIIWVNTILNHIDTRAVLPT